MCENDTPTLKAYIKLNDVILHIGDEIWMT